jgi:hypothetical protein
MKILIKLNILKNKMETKQTAMKSLIFWLQSGWKDEDIDLIIKKCESLLKSEKSDIDLAYHNGVIDGINRLPIRHYYNKYHGTIPETEKS